MNNLVLALLALGLGLGGCSSGSDCDSVGTHVAKLVKTERAGRAQISEACKLGQWDDAVRRCLVGASDKNAVESCMQKLPEFVAYATRSKTSEALELVQKLYRGATGYYLTEAFSTSSMELLPSQFPNLSAGPTPPLGSCCKQGGKCRPDPSLWLAPTWLAVQFSVDDPHYYSYQYLVLDSRKQFVVRAFGDLDCDGVYSTFAMTGEVAELSDGPQSSGMVQDRELE